MKQNRQIHTYTNYRIGATLRDILSKSGISPEKIDRIEKPLSILYEDVFSIMEQEPTLTSHSFYKYMDMSMAARLLDRPEQDFEKLLFSKELRNFEIAVQVLNMLARSERINTEYTFYQHKHRIENFRMYMAPEQGDCNYISSEITAAAAIYCGFDYELPFNATEGCINIADQGYQLFKDQGGLLNALVAGI